MCTGDDSAEMRRPGPANPRELIMRSRKMSSHVAVWNRAGTNERMLYIRVQVWGFRGFFAFGLNYISPGNIALFVGCCRTRLDDLSCQ